MAVSTKTGSALRQGARSDKISRPREEFAAYIHSETEKWSKVLKAAGSKQSDIVSGEQ